MKKFLALLLAFALCFALGGCSDEEFYEEDPFGEEPSVDSDWVYDGETEWAIYWYLCGSDLETNGGAATVDLVELTEVQLPEGVQIVIQTGGSALWQNDLVDPDLIQRFVYDSTGLNLVDEQPSANMGDPQTLADFLNFASYNFPAKKTAVIFWNHGGGSVTGAAFDELYGLDSLTLEEMYAAFSLIWDPDFENPPLELVGFDTCLMATVDVASVFKDFSKYLVGSQELEPGNGWNYTGWAEALGNNPGMDGAEFGTAICDTYYEGCEMYGTHESATLSLTDLSKVNTLLESYETFGAEALAAACEDPAFFSQFARAANSSENYGGNTREQGYTNMVDLGHLARQTAGMLGSAQNVLDALDECILYRVQGPYRSEATGLSCYYSYNGDVDDFHGFSTNGVSTAFKYFFAYELTGELNEDGMAYIGEMNFEELPEVMTLPDTDWYNADLGLNEDGQAVLDLGPEAESILAGIGFSLYMVDVDSGFDMCLGSDNDIIADWEQGIFYDNFRGVWGALDSCLVYMELSAEGEDYNIYSVPILLNEERYNLQVVYDFTAKEWSIIGATQGVDENGMADKEMRILEPGDEITTIWYIANDEGEYEAYAADVITVTEETAFGEATLPDGSYYMVFQMYDAVGNYAYSEGVTFDCESGEIYTTVYG